jgi:hypothetical protein
MQPNSDKKTTLYSSEYTPPDRSAKLRLIAFAVISDGHYRLRMYCKIDGDTWHHSYASSRLWLITTRITSREPR